MVVQAREKERDNNNPIKFDNQEEIFTFLRL